MTHLPLPQRIYFRANGEANSYSLIDQDAIKWVMALLLNGEHTTARQVEILERMAACWNACQNIETSVLEEHALGVIESNHIQQRADLLNAAKAAKDFFGKLPVPVKTYGDGYMLAEDISPTLVLMSQLQGAIERATGDTK